MSGPVRHELDQPGMRPVRRAGLELVEQLADRLDDVQVCALAATADAVGLAHAPVLQRRPQRTHVILDVQPVAHVIAAAVDRQSAAAQCVQRHKRDQFLGELARSVVVRAVREDQRQPVRVMPGAGEMV